jgi:pyrimidine-nucleoside phosphorylase
MLFLPAEIIKKKRSGQELSSDEIDFFIQGYTQGKIPDYQMSALLMAIYFKSMNQQETLHLTQSMLKSGVTVDFSSVPGFKVDKHSTGGVGDKTSLILGPIVAACGVPVPMISGRGLGHTGGTLDKLESIPGFNTQLNLDLFVENIRKYKICFIGQTKEICPADKKMYALRDVTATVESLPLICASIMSKKLAEGVDGLVLDVKYGSGAFMKSIAQASALAENLMSIAKGAGKKITALITNMDQPLGRFAGNSLEVEECLRIMRGESIAPDTRELSLLLSAHMLFLAGAEKTIDACYAMAEKALSSGMALKKFEELCFIHGGKIDLLPKAKSKWDVCTTETGYISQMNTEKIGIVGIKIKAGRAITTDVIEPTAGIEFHKKIGEHISSGEPLFTLYGENIEQLKGVEKELLETVVVSKTKSNPSPLVAKVIT